METSLCPCGCRRPVKIGNKFATRTCANQAHGRELYQGKPHKKAWLEKCGHGRSVDENRYRVTK